MASVALDTAGDVNEPFRFFGTVQTFSPGREEVLHSDSQMQKYVLSLVDAADDQHLLTRVKECTGALWDRPSLNLMPVAAKSQHLSVQSGIDAVSGSANVTNG